MANELTRPVDAQTAAQARITKFFGDQLYAQKTLLLAEGMESTTLDTKRFTKTEAAGGTVAIANGVMTLATGVNAAGNGAWDTTKKMTAIPGGALLLRALMRFGTDSIADNTREIGFRDAAKTTKVYLQAGTSLAFRMDRAGVNQFSTDVTGFLNVNANQFFLLEVLYSRQFAELWINGLRVGNITLQEETRTTLPMYKNLFTAYADALNAGNVTDSTIEFGEISIWHVGDVNSGPVRPIEMTGTGADQQIIYGPGVLTKVISVTGAGESWVIRDGTSAAGDPILNDDSAGTTGDIVDFGADGVAFMEGLFFDSSAGGTDDLRLFVRAAG